MKIYRNISLIVFAVIFLLVSFTSAENPKDWMPDPNLRRVVSEKLDVETLTIADIQQPAELLIFEGHGIKNLKGLEHAINLKTLAITHEEISDLTPLSGLQNLEVLLLFDNRIVDISPLSHLTQLESLELQNNQITDFRPLLRLTNLQYLDIRDNPDSGAGQFVSADPAIINALRVWMCHFERPTYVRTAQERIENRDYPSIHFANTGEPGLEQHLARSDFFADTSPFGILPDGGLRFERSPFGGFVRSVNGYWHIQDAKEVHEDILLKNPNTLFLAEIRYYDGHQFGFTEDSPYWLRNPDGTILHSAPALDAQGNVLWRDSLVDFTNPDVIEMIVAQAVAVANCGLYDGIVLDNWNDENGVLGDLSPETVLTARHKILQSIRKAVPDDFLIAINSSSHKIHTQRTAPYVNAALMETWASSGFKPPDFSGERYIRQDYVNYEERLLWNETRLREPKFTLLACKLPSYVDRHSPQSQQTVRTFTTLSLTHSDGYVNVHQTGYSSLYYNFFDAPLGRPIGAKAQPYVTPKGVSIEGLFIREFTGGYAVYNRSGKERQIYLPEKVTSWHAGIKEKHWHTIGDLDGEIYLKPTAAAEDVNADGIVNILDLVLISNAME